MTNIRYAHHLLDSKSSCHHQGSFNDQWGDDGRHWVIASGQPPMFHHHLERLQDGWGLARWGGSEKKTTSSRSSFAEALLVLYECRWMEIWYFKFGQGMELLTWMIWFALEHLTICGCEDRWKGGSLDCNSNKKPATGGESDSYYLQDCNLRA